MLTTPGQSTATTIETASARYLKESRRAAAIGTRQRAKRTINGITNVIEERITYHAVTQDEAVKCAGVEGVLDDSFATLIDIAENH